MTSTTSSPQGVQAQSAPEQAKETVREVAQKAGGQTRDQIRSQLSERTTQVGEQAASAANAMRRASSQLREENNGRAAEAIDAIADRGQRLGEYLRDADGDRLLRDVEDFARRQPWLMVGGSAVIGFLGSRFLKASSHGRYQSRQALGTYPSRQLPSPRAHHVEGPTDADPSSREAGLGGSA